MDPGSVAAGVLLAVETSTRRLSLALVRDEAVLAEHAAEVGARQAETLLPAIEALLEQARVRCDAVEAFAVAVGPGSFTGLRVGLATVKALAFGADACVAAVPTLAALAAAAPPGPAVALLDARRGELDAARFARAGEDVEPEEACLLRADALAAWLPPDATLVAGEGTRAAAEAARGPRRLIEAEACALRVARLGQRLLASGAGVTAEALRPRYGRLAEAEVRRLRARE